jgi:hypothetical protein
VDRNAAKVPNMPVTTSGTRVFSDLTNTLGCAVFGYIPIGGYTGTATSAGWVDRDGNPTATGSATVSQGNVSTVQLTYDVAGSLAVTLDGAAPTGAKLNVSQPAFVTPHTLNPTYHGRPDHPPDDRQSLPVQDFAVQRLRRLLRGRRPERVQPAGGFDTRDPGLPRDTADGAHAADDGHGQAGHRRSERRQREDHLHGERLQRGRHGHNECQRRPGAPDALWPLRRLRQDTPPPTRRPSVP